MNRNVLTYSIAPLISFIIFLFLSCDLLIQSDPVRRNNERLVSYTIESDAGWKDNIIVYTDGVVQYNPLEGERVPSVSRSISKAELMYLTNLFDDFDALNSGYIQEPSYTLYTIEYYGEEGVKTVVCDEYIFSHGVWYHPEYSLLRKIVTELNDIRISLIGEKKYTGKLKFNLTPETSAVSLDEPVVLQYTVTNVTNTNIRLGFANQQQLGYKVYYEDEILMTFPGVFQPATSGWEIPAGSEETKQTAWMHNIQDEIGFYNWKARSGTYTIVQFLLDGISPFQTSRVTITEEGDEKIQTDIIYDFSTPVTFTYGMNNRVSESFAFSFNSDECVGIRITSQETGKVVLSDTIRAEKPGELLLEAFGNKSFIYSWDRKNITGERVPPGFYTVEMWLIGQDPDLKAQRRYYNSGGN